MIELRTRFLLQPPPCSGQKFSTVRATVRGGPFLVKKTLSRALRGDPNHQNMFRIYTTNKPYVSRDMSYPSWYMHALPAEGSWVQYPRPEPFLALFLALLALFLALFQHYKCT